MPATYSENPASRSVWIRWRSAHIFWPLLPPNALNCTAKPTAIATNVTTARMTFVENMSTASTASDRAADTMFGKSCAMTDSIFSMLLSIIF